VVKSWAGPAVAGLIVVGIAAVLLTNLQPGGPARPSRLSSEGSPKGDGAAPGAKGDQETPIGDPVVKNQIQVAAVYLSAVAMEGMGEASSGPDDLIHLEADVKATEGNPNGFAKDEFVPYLKITYAIVPASGGAAVDRGELTPMVAWDGLHYGANVARPKPGEYRLVYEIQPPSAGGLGRHSDPATGVAPWWAPFETTFEWTVEAPKN
jgi:uncharacterized protein involved in high-affinity Fe2+ transport